MKCEFEQAELSGLRKEQGTTRHDELFGGQCPRNGLPTRGNSDAFANWNYGYSSKICHKIDLVTSYSTSSPRSRVVELEAVAQ